MGRRPPRTGGHAVNHRHPSIHGQPDLDWERYEAELRDRCTVLDLVALVVLVVISYLPIVALVIWWLR